MSRNLARTQANTGHGKSTAGFTIVELMVASAITLVIAGTMIAITSGVMSSWNRSRQGLTLRNEIRFAQDQLTSDLEGARFRADGGAWLIATVQPDQDFNTVNAVFRGDVGGSNLPFWTASNLKPGWANPGTQESSQILNPDSGRLDDYRFGMAGMWVRFFSVPPDNHSSGGSVLLENASAPRAVAYQVIRARITSSNTSPVRYCLFRSEVRPSHSDALVAPRSAFAVGYDLRASAYNDGATSSGEAEPGGIRRPDRNLILAVNVIDFGLRFIGTDSNGTRWVFPSADNQRCFIASAAPSSLPEGSAYRYSDPGETLVRFPSEAEVLVRVLSESGAEQIERFEGGLGEFPPETTWWSLALQNSRVITWRVQFRSSPLSNPF